MTEPWRATVTAVLYRTQFAQSLDVPEAHHTAEWLVRNTLWDLTIEDHYRDLTQALDSGAALDTVVQSPFSEADKRTFLTNVITALDTMRPWPARPYREIPIDRWQEFVHLPPIARIDLPWPDLQPLLQRPFKKPPGYTRELLLLRLNSGTEIAFIHPGWPSHPGTALVARNPTPKPESVVQELLSVTPLDPAKVTLLPSTPPSPSTNQPPSTQSS
ncbi:hypothetical protein [Nocardia sp. NPDC005825]|uniref:hypothetical protein n=1 Tax=unclassified Nocardia TaxID=2637762 RepID=UPI0033FDE5E0